MPPIFERFFGRRREEKQPGGLTRLPQVQPSGPVEVFRPAGPPGAPGADIFDILAPPSAPEAGPLRPATAREAAPFEILAPAPQRPMPAPLAPVRAPATEAPPGPPPPLVPRREEPSLIEEFLDPMDVERQRRGIVPLEALDQVVDLDELLRMTKDGRRDPAFVRDVRNTLRGGPPAVLPLLRIAKEERGAEDKVADFLRIPRSEIQGIERARRDPWIDALNPGLYEIERGLDWYLGDQVPGTFHFGVNDQGEFGLMYLEEHPEL